MTNKSKYLRITITALILLSFQSVTGLASASKEVTYLSKSDFLELAYPNNNAELKAVWVKGELKNELSKILGHDYSALRIRYWRHGQRFAWILEEIGRDKPITLGFVIDEMKIEQFRLLVFRESRGNEIRLPGFSAQFKGIELDHKNNLNRHIDGISGATLSVNAARKLAAVSLKLTQHVSQKKSK
jgi:hypothetical protein